MLCETCEKREYCTELCPEAEAYVNQDHVPQKHLIPSKPIKLSTEDWYEQNTVWDYSVRLSPYYQKRSDQLKNLIIGLYLDGKNTLEISYHLPCNFSYAARIIREYKKGCTEFKTNLP